MAADGITATVRGIPDLRAALLSIPDTLRKRVLLNALRAGARVVRDAARAAAPELASPSPYRTKGLLRKSISVRTSKLARRSGDIGVFVNVRPAKGAKYGWTSGVFGTNLGRQRFVTRASQRGAKSKVDPFYWRFINWGWRPRGNGAKIAGKEFLEAGVKALDAALDQIENYIARQVQKMNNKGSQL
jgi:hypothetical protein